MKYVRWGDFVIGGSPEGEQLIPVFQSLYGIEKHTTAAELMRILGEAVYHRMTSMALIREPLKVIESDYRFAVRLFDQFARRHARTTAEVSDVRSRTMQAVRVDRHPQIPKWWYTHHEGSIIQAILASSFDEYLERVCDRRWDRILAGAVTDSRNRIIVTDTIKIEEAACLRVFFSQRLKMNDFEIRHENKGLALDLIWPSDLKSELRAICSYDYDLFKY